MEKVIQVNRMEKKYLCTDECCTGGLRPPAHPSSDTCPLRGQQAPSAPTTEITGQKQAGLV